MKKREPKKRYVLPGDFITTAPLRLQTNVVLEGNERLCCLRQIAKGLESGDDYYTDHAERLTFLINNVPVRILPDDVTSREIAMMHADWHIGSKDPWKPINQARHIYEMVNQGISKDEIASRLRKSRPWVYGKLAAYEMAEKHFDRHARWEETSEFSYFEELYKKKKALSDHGFDIEVEENFEKFSDWVVEKNIPRALDVRKLTKVLSYPETKELIFNGEGSRAFKELAIYDASSASPRFAAIERLNNQLRKMNWEDFRMIATNESHRELVQETISRLQKTLETVDSMEWA